MDLQTSKIELTKLIQNIENIEFIEKLKSYIINKNTDLWSILSQSEKEEIDKGIKELENDERILFDDFLNNIS